MNTQKVELHFMVTMYGTSSQKVVILDVDYSILSKLNGSSTVNDTIQSLVGHMYPGGKISGGSCTTIREIKHKTEKKKNIQSSSDNNFKIKIKSPFKKPVIWIPFRLIWVIFLIILKLFLGILNIFSIIFSTKD